MHLKFRFFGFHILKKIIFKFVSWFSIVIRECCLYYIYLWKFFNYILDFPGGSVVKNLPAKARDARDTSLILGLERSPGEGDGNPLQYSCLGNFTDKGAWQAIVHVFIRVRHELVTK